MNEVNRKDAGKLSEDQMKTIRVAVGGCPAWKDGAMAERDIEKDRRIFTYEVDDDWNVKTLER